MSYIERKATSQWSYPYLDKISKVGSNGSNEENRLKSPEKIETPMRNVRLDLKFRFPILLLLFLFSFAVIPAELHAAMNSEIHLVTQNGTLYLPCTIESEDGRRSKVLFMLDTGCGRTVILRSVAEKHSWNLVDNEWNVSTLWGISSFKKAVIFSKLEIGDHSFLNVKCPIVDWVFPEEIKDEEGNAIPVVGMLGQEILYSSSFFLSISQRAFGWSDTCPWVPDRSVKLLLHGLSANRWGVLCKSFEGPEEDFYLIDTGVFQDAVPQVELADLQKRNPKKWIQIDDLEKSITVGSIEGTTPLDPCLSIRRGIAGISTFAEHSLGVQYLCSFDLWYDLTKPGDERVLVRRADPEQADAFRKAVNLAHWYYYHHARGFSIDPSTGKVVRVVSWGDGTPFVKNINVGDIITSVGGEPWDKDSPFLRNSKDAIEFRWLGLKDGKSYTANVAWQNVFDY